MFLYKVQTGTLASEYHHFWFLDIFISKKPLNNVGIKMTKYNISVLLVCLTKNLLSPVPVRWRLCSPVREMEAHAIFSNTGLCPKRVQISDLNVSTFLFPLSNSLFPSYQDIAKTNGAFQDYSCGHQKKFTIENSHPLHKTEFQSWTLKQHGAIHSNTK